MRCNSRILNLNFHTRLDTQFGWLHSGLMVAVAVVVLIILTGLATYGAILATAPKDKRKRMLHASPLGFLASNKAKVN